MNVMTRGARNAFRNRVRTVSIVLILGLAIGLSLVMDIAHAAVNQKIDSIKSSVGNTINISPAGFTPGSQANNTLSSTQIAKISSVSHVTSVTQTLSDRLTTTGSSQPSFPGRESTSTTNNQTSLISPVTINADGDRGRAFVSGGGTVPTNFTPPITILGTTDPLSVDGSTLNISQGSVIDGNKDANEAIVSDTTATRNNLQVGSVFQAYGVDITVKGIYKAATSGSAGAGNAVIVSISSLQRLTNQSGAVTAATVTVDSADNLAAATSSITANFGNSADVQNAQNVADSTVKPLISVSQISLFSLIGALVAGAVIIFKVMLMIVRERRREIGILKAIGAKNSVIIRQFMVESIVLTMLALVIGVVIGTAAATPVTNSLVSSASSSTASTMPRGMGRMPESGISGGLRANRELQSVRSSVSSVKTTVGIGTLAYGFLSAILIAVVGSGLAAYMISHVRPAEVMRAE